MNTYGNPHQRASILKRVIPRERSERYGDLWKRQRPGLIIHTKDSLTACDSKLGMTQPVLPSYMNFVLLRLDPRRSVACLHIHMRQFPISGDDVIFYLLINFRISSNG